MNDHPNHDDLRAIMPEDDLDQLLREWHGHHAESAAALRDQLMARLAEDHADVAGRIHAGTPAPPRRRLAPLFHPGLQVAASLAILLTLVGLLIAPALRHPGFPAVASRAIAAGYVSEGGRLDAFAPHDRTRLGTCPLQHTDVDVDITGPLARVTVTQQYANPFDQHIEALYTFPLSHDAAVNRMTLTVGDRVIEGEVRERAAARQIYDAARAQGQVAALLEQQRPNIFTQSVANIPPRQPVTVTITYLERIDSTDGARTFHFPMTIGPRYIPGQIVTPPTDPHAPHDAAALPQGLLVRQGAVLPAPDARVTAIETVSRHAFTLQSLRDLLSLAIPIEPLDLPEGAGALCRFTVQHGDVTEQGVLYANGVGVLAGRWFCHAIDPGRRADIQVPDALRILPPYTRPSQRAGHDIDLTVTLDTGGPGLLDLSSELHTIQQRALVIREDGLPAKMTLALNRRDEIPNRDFVLTWKQTADTVENAVFTHAGDLGQFVTFMLMPPKRVDDEQVLSRDLIFVIDCSGSMAGFPVSKAKDVLSRALATMRPQDRFNIIAFNNATTELWSAPRHATPEAVAEAQHFVDRQQGGGGTEMMAAVQRALAQHAPGADALDLRALLDLPNDDREVTVRVTPAQLDAALRTSGISTGGRFHDLRFLAGPELPVFCRVDATTILFSHDEEGDALLRGRWSLVDGQRTLLVSQRLDERDPMRLIVFLTDGQVGNDMSILATIDEACRNAPVRFFSVGIGDSTNRYLLDGMARAGRGVADYVTLQSDADAAVQRFAARIRTPVLRDVTLHLPAGLALTDIVVEGMTTGAEPVEGEAGAWRLPDLYDVAPVVVHAKYTGAGDGEVSLSGVNAGGDWGRTLAANFPAAGTRPAQSTVATMWARARVEQLMNQDLDAVQRGTLSPAIRDDIVRLGETYSLLTQYTSFIAVERTRVNFEGRPTLVRIPLETPSGQVYQNCQVLLSRQVEAVTRGRERAAREISNERIEALRATARPADDISDVRYLLEASDDPYLLRTDWQAVLPSGATVIDVLKVTWNLPLDPADLGDASFYDSLMISVDGGEWYSYTSGDTSQTVLGSWAFVDADGNGNAPPDPQFAPPADQTLHRGTASVNSIRVAPDQGFSAPSWEIQEERRRAIAQPQESRDTRGNRESAGQVQRLYDAVDVVGTEPDAFRLDATTSAPPPASAGEAASGGGSGVAGDDNGILEGALSRSVDEALAAAATHTYPADALPIAFALFSRDAVTTTNAETITVTGSSQDHLILTALLGELAAARDDLASVQEARPVSAPSHAAAQLDQALLTLLALVKDDRLADARTLADTAAGHFGDVQPLSRIRALLQNDTLTPEDRLAHLEALTLAARTRLDTLATITTLARRIDTDLLTSLATRETTADQAEARLGIRTTTAVASDSIPITILINAADPDALRRLRAAGLTIEDTSTASGIIVGRADLATIPALALDPATRKIERLH